MSNGGLSNHLSKSQTKRRQALLGAMQAVLEGMRMNARAACYGNWDSGAFLKSLTCLEEACASFLANKSRHDMSIEPFFRGQEASERQVENFFRDPTESARAARNDFLVQESIFWMGQFLDRGLPTLKMVFRHEGMSLPAALELLHAEYHNPNAVWRGKIEKKAKPIQQQHWFSPVFEGLELSV